MTMHRVELVAVDAAAGEAVVRNADRWYLVAREQSWYPVEVESERARYLSGGMLRVWHPCDTFEEAMSEIRRICAGLPPSRPNADSWEERFPDLIRRFGGLLDWYFERRGCPVDESFRLSLETFNRLFEMGPADESEIRFRLHQLAADVCSLHRRSPAD